MWCCLTRATSKQGQHSPTCEFAAGHAECPNHKVIAHDAEGLMRWCDFCGKDTDGVKVSKGNGGWGTPSGTNLSL